jgi:hypothetical protein
MMNFSEVCFATCLVFERGSTADKKSQSLGFTANLSARQSGCAAASLALFVLAHWCVVNGIRSVGSQCKARHEGLWSMTAIRRAIETDTAQPS